MTPQTSVTGEQPDLIEVTVRDRGAEPTWGSGPGRVVTRKIAIFANCPVCGDKRGERRGLSSYDDGEHYWVQVWDNPCGHRDMYEAVLLEARKLGESR